MPFSLFTVTAAVIIIIIIAALEIVILYYFVTRAWRRRVRRDEGIKYFEKGKARIRPLLDGRFVAEVQRYNGSQTWYGVDLTRPGRFFWPRYDTDYNACIGTYDQCFAALAWSGVPAEPKTNRPLWRVPLPCARKTT